MTNPRTGQETAQFNYNGHWVGEAQFKGLTGAKPGTETKRLHGADLAAAYNTTYTRFVNSTGGQIPRNKTGKGYETQIAEFVKAVTGPEIGWPMVKAVAQVKARFPQYGMTGTPGAPGAPSGGAPGRGRLPPGVQSGTLQPPGTPGTNTMTPTGQQAFTIYQQSKRPIPRDIWTTRLSEYDRQLLTQQGVPHE